MAQPTSSKVRCLATCACLFGLLGLASGCGGHGAPQSADTKAPAPSEKPLPTLDKPAWVGGVLNGDDPDALRAYLSSVKEVTPTKFKVEWNPSTVAFDRAATLRALRGASRDGHRFTLDPAEPAVAKLAPGSILWLYDVTVSKVERVERRDGSAVVYTTPVALNEAMPNAEITFDAQAPVGNFMLGRHPPHPAASARRPPPASNLRFVSLGGPGPETPPAKDAPGAPPTTAADEQQAAADEASADEDAFAGNTYRHELKGYDVQLQYAPGEGDTLKIRIEARKSEAGDGQADAKAPEGDAAIAKGKLQEVREEETKVRDEIREIRTHLYEAQEGHAVNPALIKDQEHLLKEAIARKEKLDESKIALKQALSALQDKVWEVVSDAFDVRFKAQINLEGFSTAGHFLFAQGHVEEAQLAFKALHARAKVKVVTRLGNKGAEGTKIPLMDVPIVFNVPMPIGGIPFMLQIGADFNINVFLSGQNATLAVEGEYAVNGNTGFTYSKTAAQYDGTLNGDEPGIEKAEGMTPGPSAFVLGVQLPKIGYGLGMLGVSSIAFFDIIHVLSMTSASSAVVALAPACKRITYAATGRIGIETVILPIPIEAVQNAVNEKLSPKHDVFKKERVMQIPNIKGCQLD